MPYICGTNEVKIPEEDCCEQLTCRVDQLEEDMQECCDEVKSRLDGHDDDIEELNNDVATLDQNKVDKIPGKGLSTNDYTDADKNKLDGIEAGAEVNVQANWVETDTTSDSYILNKPTIDTQMSNSSTNAVQNKAIKAYVDNLVASLPADHFLDQTKTTFVQNFAWSSSLYPGSTNPNLNGKPVLVLAVTDGTTDTYSFLNVETLLNVYTGQAPITVNGTVISHDISGVSAGAKGDTQNQTPAFGSTFKALSGTVDNKGHLLAFNEHTVKIPDTEASSTQKGLMTAAQYNKLAGITAGAEPNVQSDWNVTDSNSDAYIRNKPTIPAALTASTGIRIANNRIERVPLIGEIVETNSATAPAYYGTYEMVDKNLAYQYLENTGVTWGSATSGQTSAICIMDKKITIRIGFDAKITDDDTRICRIAYSTLGLGGSPNQHFVGYCDGAHHVGMFRASRDGNDLVIDAVDAVPHAQPFQTDTWHVQFDLFFGFSSIQDSACNRFYWKRVS